MSWLGTDPCDLDPLFKCAMDIGLLNFKIMEMLDLGETTAFGHPEPTQVRVTPVPGKCILVSGHDMVDLKLILEQTRGTGINVYTHGEMLPALAYPFFKQYPHLVGNYGSAWQNQQKEFANFPGAVVMTSNCIIDPNVGNYSDRIFTRSIVGWPGVTHLEGEDFSAVIAKAQALEGFNHVELEHFITIGFARNAPVSYTHLQQSGNEAWLAWVMTFSHPRIAGGRAVRLSLIHILCRASGVRFRAITLDNPTLSRQSVARAQRYCRHYGIPHQVLKTDEMIFSAHLGHLAEVRCV